MAAFFVLARISLFGRILPETLLLLLQTSHKATESGRFGQGKDARRRAQDATSRVVETRRSH
jgi:hypothetical protein